MIKSHFPKEVYTARRQHVSEALGSGVVLLLGNGIASYNYPDNNYLFRQDSTFLYLIGLDYEDLAAVIDIDRQQTILFGDELTVDDIIWTGKQPTLRERAELVGITDVRPAAELAKYLAGRQEVHYVPAYRGHTLMRLRELLGADTQPSMRLIHTMVDMRNHKSALEITEIEKSVAISVKMHERVRDMLHPGVTEREVAAAATEVALRDGYYLSFPVIATSHGETLHNHGYIHTLSEGDMLLLDCGAENDMHYAGDLTTTFPVSGRFTPRQQAIYDILLSTYRQAAATIRPGITYREVHLQAYTSIARGLRELGIIKGDPEEAARAGAAAMFMPHGLGHMMGLDVHDMENYGEVHVGYAPGEQKDPRFGFRSLRLGRTLEGGFVFTVEPGIYFVPDLIDQWEAQHMHEDFICYDELRHWRDFGGMRNEEDYLITATGARRLGPAKPC